MIFGIGKKSFKKISAQDKEDMQQLTNNLEDLKTEMPNEIVEAHQHCSGHHEEILSSKVCGCFSCLAIFTPEEIIEWIYDGDCALCPKCEVDSVIGDKSGYPITKDFLKEMNQYWF